MQPEIKAKLRYLHAAPRKVRLVVSAIRGLDASKAELQLCHIPKRASTPILKLLQSAIANARHNFQIEGELTIKEARVDEGPAARRFMPRAFGRAALIKKRTSHVTLVLIPKETTQVRAPAKRTKRSGPVVREATIKDLKDSRSDRSKEEGTEGRGRRSGGQKSGGFSRRIFNRKAI